MPSAVRRSKKSLNLRIKTESVTAARVDAMVYVGHRRRMETEGQAKVVASGWGEKFIRLPAARAVLSRSMWKKRFNPCLLFPSFFYDVGLLSTYIRTRHQTNPAAFAPTVKGLVFMPSSTFFGDSVEPHFLLAGIHVFCPTMETKDVIERNTCVCT